MIKKTRRSARNSWSFSCVTPELLAQLSPKSGKGNSKVAREAQKWQGKLKIGKENSKVARETQKWQGKLKSGKENSKVARETQKWQGKLKSTTRELANGASRTTYVPLLTLTQQRRWKSTVAFFMWRHNRCILMGCT